MRDQGEVHQHSGWLVPLGFLLTIILLSGLVLLYYLRPLTGLLRDNRPTAAVTAVTLDVRGTRLVVPANYLESRAVRGGTVENVALFALLPDMRGYSEGESRQFASDAADSAVLHLLVKADNNRLDAASRFARVYKPYIRDPAGVAGPDGLTRYDFRADSAYRGDDLYAGNDGAMLLLLCERPAQDVPSPNCLSIDRPVAPGVGLSYRFKRSQLARWRAINQGADALVSSFEKN